MNNESLMNLLSDEKLCEALSEVFMQEIESDDETPDRRGCHLINAYMNKDVDALLIALCGWSFKTLLGKAKGLVAESDM